LSRLIRPSSQNSRLREPPSANNLKTAYLKRRIAEGKLVLNDAMPLDSFGQRSLSAEA